MGLRSLRKEVTILYFLGGDECVSVVSLFFCCGQRLKSLFIVGFQNVEGLQVVMGLGITP
jgi:hypothetical protein